MGPFKWGKRDKALMRYEPGQNGQAPATITGCEVVVRPDLVITDGKLLPGVTNEVATGLMAASLRRLLKADQVPVDVRPVDYLGRFARIEYRIPDWEGPVTFCLLAGTCDRRVHEAWETYRDGWALKVRQLHRRTQSLDGANARLEAALGKWSSLREAEARLVSEGEYAYMMAEIANTLSMQSLVPPPHCEPQTLVPKAADPRPA